MILIPRQENYNINNRNMNLSPQQHRRHHHDDNNSLSNHLNQHLLQSSKKCYSPRPGQRSKFPPHIQICPPEENDVIKSRFLKREELDNDVFQTSNSGNSSPKHLSNSSLSDEKHEVYSGRLFIVRHTGNGSSTTASSSRSPTGSPSRSSSPSVAFRSSPTSFTQQWSPLNSPTSSPKPKINRRTPVFVRVYRCNLDHFAVITRDVLYSSKPVYVNLRHRRILPGEFLGRFIVAGKCDSGNVIEFEAPELSTLEQWLDAFQACTPPASPSRVIGGSCGSGSSGSGVLSSTPPIPRSPAMPTLTETDEDD